MEKVIAVNQPSIELEAQKQDASRVFKILSTYDITAYTGPKGNLKYLPWNHAWAIVKSIFPMATFTIYKNEMGWNYFTDTKTCWVDVGVTIEGLEMRVTRPVYGNKPNEALPYDKVTADQVWNSIARCLVKCCALHGLGIQLWSGTEDEICWDAGLTVDVEKVKTVEVPEVQNITPPAPKPKAKKQKVEEPAPAPTPDPAPQAVVAPAPEAPAPTAVVTVAPEAPAPSSAQVATPQPIEMATPQAPQPVPQATPAHQFICNADGKLIADENIVLTFEPRAVMEVAEAKTVDFFISDTYLKKYAHLTCDQAFGKMIKDLDLDALNRLAQFLALPDEKFAELTDAQKSSLNAAATIAQVKLSKPFTWPMKK